MYHPDLLEVWRMGRKGLVLSEAGLGSPHRFAVWSFRNVLCSDPVSFRKNRTELLHFSAVLRHS